MSRTENMKAAIEVSDVSLVYGDGTVAVSNLDMRVDEGEFYGFLGPNGAGKTTTIKMLVTLLRPSDGNIRVNGYDVVDKPRKVRQTVGYMPQETSIDRELTARENLQYACDAYRVDRDKRSERIEELLELVDLADVADKRASGYSGGMKKRLDAATALVHEPDLVFLDEPTTGLDPKARNRLWDYFERINQNGTTILLTTQYLEEADYLCERIGIILNGSIERSGNPEELKQSVGNEVLSVEFGSEDSVQRAESVLSEKLDGAEVKSGDGRVQVVQQNVGERTMRIMSILNDERLVVTGLDVRTPTLDDVFLETTGGTIEELSEKDGDNA